MTMHRATIQEREREKTVVKNVLCNHSTIWHFPDFFSVCENERFLNEAMNSATIIAWSNVFCLTYRKLRRRDSHKLNSTISYERGCTQTRATFFMNTEYDLNSRIKHAEEGDKDCNVTR